MNVPTRQLGEISIKLLLLVSTIAITSIILIIYSINEEDNCNRLSSGRFHGVAIASDFGFVGMSLNDGRCLVSIDLPNGAWEDLQVIYDNSKYGSKLKPIYIDVYGSITHWKNHDNYIPAIKVSKIYKITNNINECEAIRQYNLNKLSEYIDKKLNCHGEYRN